MNSQPPLRDNGSPRRGGLADILPSSVLRPGSPGGSRSGAGRPAPERPPRVGGRGTGGAGSFARVVGPPGRQGGGVGMGEVGRDAGAPEHGGDQGDGAVIRRRPCPQPVHTSLGDQRSESRSASAGTRTRAPAPGPPHGRRPERDRLLPLLGLRRSTLLGLVWVINLKLPEVRHLLVHLILRHTAPGSATTDDEVNHSPDSRCTPQDLRCGWRGPVSPSRGAARCWSVVASCSRGSQPARTG